MSETGVNTESLKQFESRKRDHIQLALDPDNQVKNAGFDQIELIHEAIPDVNFNEIDISTNSLDGANVTPFFISSMTAGHANSLNINNILAKACSITHWAMGVGSQRRELFDKSALTEWQKIRKENPNVTLFGNIGLAQAITTTSAQIQALVDPLEAKAMIIHCNPLQECIQPEGTPNFQGAWEALTRLRWDLSVPLIIKETGCGFSTQTLAKLKDIGVAVVDVSGFGGTHWGRIEGARCENSIQQQTAFTFKDWGINTVSALMNAKSIHPDYEIWASGGVRSGLDAAKCLALGATRIGIAKPMLEAALQGVDAVVNAMHTFEYELKTALFCTGCHDLDSLMENKIWQIKK